MDIRENDFRKLDLNLLVAFLVLMRERSVSRAAERLHLGQPAVSGALARLREFFDDPLFVRTRSGMQPTSRAMQLESRLKPALLSIHQAVFEGMSFDPSRSEQTFVIGMPDWVEIWLAPRLFTAVRRAAPGVRLSIVNTDPFRAAEMLERGEMDLAVTPVQAVPAWCRQGPLRRMGYRCVFSSANAPRAGLSLRAYLERTHLLVSYRGAFESAADEWLASRSLARRVVFATSRFGILPSLLEEDMTITTVPEMLAQSWRGLDGLRIAPCPVPLPEIALSQLWLATRDSEAPLRWLRETVGAAAKRNTRGRSG
ncbi:LysR family transcriptional regulator [Noviherbaspirillum aridicola]|uniref:LysR family transcriptional regulator n=1 Tax=Noviherbaspirillum aridicola TaxID=2849687 RepID=A0ABQ4Q042_9BURK|nr:LysR family transcriptional regulator [Noviherbaspirillum aridicola]GIZ50443.1 LysR family transcriptional regulator [Noviherbaspirillum aridicola]